MDAGEITPIIKHVQPQVSTIHVRDNALSILIEDEQSKRSFGIEHPIKLDAHKECNLTYMVNARGQFRVWRYAELRSSHVRSTGWLMSPALATFLHLATLHAAELSFASRLSLLPALFPGFGDVSPGDIADLIARLEAAKKARDLAQNSYYGALLGEATAALGVFGALRGKGTGLKDSYTQLLALVGTYISAKNAQRSLELAEEAVKSLEDELEGRRVGHNGGAKKGDSGSSSGSTSGGSGSGSSSGGKSGGSGTGDDSGGGPRNVSDDQCKTYQQDPN